MNLMLVIVVVFFIGTRKSLRTCVIVGAFCFFVVGGNRESNVGNCGCFFWMGNHEALCWCLLFFLSVEIANLILVIAVFFELETTNR